MKFLRTAAILGTLAALSACDLTGGEKSSTTKDPESTTGQTETTTGTTAIKLFGSQGQATDSTVNALKSMKSDEGGRLDEGTRQNLLSANATYRSELAADPDDHEAQFGIAVTTLSLKIDKIADTLKKMSDKGLDFGGTMSGSMFQINPNTMIQSQAFSARALAKPENSPAIGDLQNVLEKQLMPTIDSAIGFLNSCWKDPSFSYRFAVMLGDKRDSVTIGRADIGFALAGLRTARAYFIWILAQNVDCNFPGQGFATDYTWIDTLRNIQGNVGPATAAQRTAFSNLQSLLNPGSKFLTIRTGYQTKINAIPQELVDIADLAKEAGEYSALHQRTFSEGLVHLDIDDNADFAKAMDSVKYYLGGMRTFVRGPHSRVEYTDSVCTWTPYGDDVGSLETYPCAGHAVLAEYPGYSIRMDISKLITQADHKVFLPKFVWNSASNWKTQGPFSLKKGSTTTPVLEFGDLKIKSPTDLESYIEWADPTFGGAFTFKSTLDLLTQFEAMDEKPISTQALAPDFYGL